MLILAIWVLCILFSVHILKDTTVTIKERLGSVAAVMTFSVFAALLFYMVCGIAWRKEVKYYEKKTYELVALKDNTVTQGSIFFFSGTMRYYFYYQEPNGAVKMQTIPIRNTEIYEKQRKDGTVIQYNVWAVSKKGFKWISPIRWWDRRCNKYVVRIPEGTIKRDFILDLE